MSTLAQAQPFPNFFLKRPDGTLFELVDLYKKQHAVLLFVSRVNSDVLVFVTHFQDQARVFDWLDSRLIVIYQNLHAIVTPWPAPAYPPCLYSGTLPDGVQWGQAYVVSKHGTLLETYPELDLLSVAKVERDLLYWEAGHCLP